MRGKKEGSTRSIPLNCVDKCLLALDGANEPMLIHIILSLDGEIEHVRLNQAIFSAQQAYLVMRTILRSRHFRLFREIQEDLGKGVLSVPDQAQLQGTNHERYLSSWMNQPLNIRKEDPIPDIERSAGDKNQPSHNTTDRFLKGPSKGDRE